MIFRMTKNNDLTAHDYAMMTKAVRLSAQSPITDRFRVGCVIADEKRKILATGFTQEGDPLNHAEEVALGKLTPEFQPDGVTLYATMEPCSERASREKSCSELIIASGIKRVVFALEEPPVFVTCQGHALLQDTGITVMIAKEFSTQIRKLNKHLIAK